MRLDNISIKNKIFFFALIEILLLSAGIVLIFALIPDLNPIAFIGYLCVLIFLFVVISLWVSRYLTRPMLKLTKISDEISRGNLDLHPNIGTEVRCWEMKQCGERECPAYGNTDRPCWYIDQTLVCGSGLSGDFQEKADACLTCDVYKQKAGDEIIQMANSIRNMTIRLKASEDGLRDSETKYRSLFDSGPNPIFVLDKETFEILDASSSAERIYGYSKEELVGKRFTDLGPFEYEGAYLTGSEDNGHPSGYAFSQKVRHYKKGKEPFYVNMHSCSMVYGEREALKVVTIDITEMMEKETQLIQAGKMTSLGEMSAGMAHELNQPLNAIKLGAEFLGRMTESERKIPRDDLLQVVNRMTSQVDRAAEIINRLREFGRKAEFTKEKVEINKPVRGVFDIIGRQLRLQNIDVILDLDETLPPILAHNNRLEQVLFNLITNARDAIRNKQDMSAKPNGHAITVRSYAEGDRVSVLVSDTGAGIPTEKKDKIFEPFFTTKETGKGMGLGLSIAYGIVKDYDGDIHIEDMEGEGTTFKMTFPIASE